MTKKIIFIMMALLTMATMTSCKEEPKKTTEDPNDGFVTINESWNDGWSGSNVKTWDDVDEELENEHILTERIITETIITEQTIVETTITETYVHENFEPYISDEYKAELEFNSKKNVYFGETEE